MHTVYLLIQTCINLSTLSLSVTVQ